ncbi:MAG TPA: F0F1 ATP synthase subunit delta [Candidatus Saccharimonadia bacterium]|nr:F0F1 ATP synthase subunit delta [Candidatus Saccharimonadia bacterium]
MSATTTLARPYARAAFETAQSAGALDAWQEGLRFSAAVASHDAVGSMIGDPRVPDAQLLRLFLPDSVAADSPFAAFIGTLAQNRRLEHLPAIAQQFDALKREREGVLHVTVRAAVPVEGAQADALRAALKKRFAREIELVSVIDESVIGGAVIDAGDVVIDASVRGRLERLGQALAQ